MGKYNRKANTCMGNSWTRNVDCHSTLGVVQCPCYCHRIGSIQRVYNRPLDESLGKKCEFIWTDPSCADDRPCCASPDFETICDEFIPRSNGLGCVKVRTNSYSVPLPAGTQVRAKVPPDSLRYCVC